MKTFRDQLTPWLSNIDQIAWAREAELTSGAGRGNRIIDVDNGAGLRFTVSPDRGMDIVEASFRGYPVVFRTPGGNRSRMEYESAGAGWLRNWQGGLMTTCGLRSAGTPNAEFGLHGRIDNLPAEDTFVRREWTENGDYTIRVGGTLREAAMFGENLRLERSIRTTAGKNAIDVQDRVTNLAATPDYVQIVYHCNFGYPLVSTETRIMTSPHNVSARDENARAAIGFWQTMPPPADGDAPEQCFIHDLPAGNDGFAVFTLENPVLKCRVSVCYQTDSLPRLVQWKLFRKGMYVMGVEPTNTFLSGRTQEIADGTARKIAPGESIDFHVRFLFEDL